ncbi:MAG: transposase [Flavobacteriales bacterium]|jgi:hypothetical protein|nr:transposase [Flavobacteriales bacterium]
MIKNFKEIHLGTHIKKVTELQEFDLGRACELFKCDKITIYEMFESEALETDIVLKWCKLLEYNFFMLYHTHLQLYKPSASTAKMPKSKNGERDEESSYVFRKNLYSPEIIDWILHKWVSGELSPKEIMEKYKIPKTTLYRWKRKIKNTVL